MMTEQVIAERLAELTSSLVRIPSVNPPGGEETIALFIQELLKNQGVSSKYIPLEPHRGSLVAELPGSDPEYIVLCGHLDTVGLEGEWSFQPLSGEIKDGRVWGRGTADMKGGVAVLLESFLDAAKRRKTLKKGLRLLLTADEEGSYRGAKSLREQGLLSQTKIVLIAEPSDGNVYLGQKGELWLKAVFRGVGTHGSVPHLGVNAAQAGCEFTREIIKAVEHLPDTTWGRTSINLGRIAGGWRVNAVPDRSEVELDIRPVSFDNRDQAKELANDIGEKVASGFGAKFFLEVTNDRPPMLISSRIPLVKMFLQAAGKKTGKELIPALAPYSTDAVEFYPQLGIPFVIYGPGSIAQAHRPNEFVEISDLVQAYLIISAFLEDVLYS